MVSSSVADAEAVADPEAERASSESCTSARPPPISVVERARRRR